MDDGDSPTDGETYFTERPRSASHRHDLRFLYRGEILVFEVDSGVFAGHGLDPGTALLVEELDPKPTDRVLDLGCGWGALGVAASRRCPEGHVTLTDVNRRAVALARANLRRNRVKNAEVKRGAFFVPVAAATFDLIVSNPPFRAGRPTVLRILGGAAAHLSSGGRLLLVGKGSQGIIYYQKWLEEHWPGTVSVRSRGSGYRVLEAALGTRTELPGPDGASKAPLASIFEGGNRSA